MNREEILEYLTGQIGLLQRKAVELSEQHDSIEKEMKGYQQLIRIYRGVYESEAGVGLQNRMPSQIVKMLEDKLAEEETSAKESVKKKVKRRRRVK